MGVDFLGGCNGVDDAGEGVGGGVVGGKKEEGADALCFAAGTTQPTDGTP